MSKVSWLMRGWYIDSEINDLLYEKSSAVKLSAKTTALNSSSHKRTNYDNYNNQIDRRIDELYAVKSEIIIAINKVSDPTYRTLLFKRYIQFKKFEEISIEMNYCYKHIVHALHPKALQQIDVIECNTSNML